jgi:hypothetical protein
MLAAVFDAPPGKRRNEPRCQVMSGETASKGLHRRNSLACVDAEMGALPLDTTGALEVKELRYLAT